MKRFYLGLIVLMSGLAGSAQQEFYIFIQEPSRQPFYVRMGEENHSSSAEGHLILSRLRDSVYNLYVGFPRGRGGEHLFTITINRKDHGYELRNAGARRQLFDLQTLQLINPVASAQVNDQAIRRSDAYSDLMAGVVDDTAVMYLSVSDTIGMDTSAVKKGVVAVEVASADVTEEPGTDSVVALKPVEDNVAKKADSVTRKTDPAIAKAEITKIDTSTAGVEETDTAADNSVRDKRDIIRLRTENVQEGKLMIYVDRTGAVNDTIRIIIPRKL